MRDRRVRAAFVGLVLAFPVLMVVVNPRGGPARQAALPVFATSSVLAVGLSTVARERRRLLAERTTPAPAPGHARPAFSRGARRALPVPSATAVRS